MTGYEALVARSEYRSEGQRNHIIRRINGFWQLMSEQKQTGEKKLFWPPAFQSYTQNYFPTPTPLIRNFWGLGNRHASFFQPHFGRHIALGEATLLRALRGRSSREADTMVNG